MTIDYLVIGHLSKDLTPNGPMLGGSAAYCALTARALGQHVAVLTSFPVNEFNLLTPLDGVLLACTPAGQPTTFEIDYTAQGRAISLKNRAASLCLDHLPTDWHSPAIVHYAPVADEIDSSLLGVFNQGLVGVTAQGWMRSWDEHGRVAPAVWRNAAAVLPVAQAVVFSWEDVGGDLDLVRDYASQIDLLVFTQGPDPVLLFVHGKQHEIPVPSISEENATGAGDIFAATFFVRYHATGDPVCSARFAACIASASVTRTGLAGIPGPETIKMALQFSE